MKFFKICTIILSISFLAGVLGLRLTRGRDSESFHHAEDSSLVASFSSPTLRIGATGPVAPTRYRLEPARSKFIAHALAGGLLWFKGHDHLVAVRDFSGEVRLDPNSIPASSLEIIAKTASMEETSSVFTDAQKKIINKELHDIVLLPDQYPDIVFRSTSVTGQSIGNGQYDLKIAGNLTLNGTTRSITIPTKLTVTGNEIRAQGEFSVNRSDFKVKATSAVHGLVRVRDKIKFTFDIVGHQI